MSTRPRILCVENDEDSRVMLVTLLKLALIEAKSVGTAAQALSSIQTERSICSCWTRSCLISMALNCVAGCETSTRGHRFFSFRARPLPLTRNEGFRQEPMPM
jgi:CheY-like chemotaxis protein